LVDIKTLHVSDHLVDIKTLCVSVQLVDIEDTTCIDPYTNVECTIGQAVSHCYRCFGDSSHTSPVNCCLSGDNCQSCF